MFDSEPEYIGSNMRFLRADRSPCPVCGHPTGDCAGPSPSPIRILGETFYNGKVEDPVLVTEDIYEEVAITERTRTTVLVAKAGTYISMEKALKYGLIAPPGS